MTLKRKKQKTLYEYMELQEERLEALFKKLEREEKRELPGKLENSHAL